MQGRRKKMWNIYLLVVTDFMSTENYLLSVREYLYFLFVYFSYWWKVWIWVCWSEFSKCRYVISFHSNRWDHTELYHVSISRSVNVGCNRRRLKTSTAFPFFVFLFLTPRFVRNSRSFPRRHVRTLKGARWTLLRSHFGESDEAFHIFRLRENPHFQ